MRIHDKLTNNIQHLKEVFSYCVVDVKHSYSDWTNKYLLISVYNIQHWYSVLRLIFNINFDWYIRKKILLHTSMILQSKNFNIEVIGYLLHIYLLKIFAVLYEFLLPVEVIFILVPHVIIVNTTEPVYLTVWRYSHHTYLKSLEHFTFGRVLFAVVDKLI